jgi:hypothetical protein
MTDDQLVVSDTTDDDRAQGDDGSSSSSLIMSEDETSPLEFDLTPARPLTTSSTTTLSNEDSDKCLYVTKINWRRRFSVSSLR